MSDYASISPFLDISRSFIYDITQAKSLYKEIGSSNGNVNSDDSDNEIMNSAATLRKRKKKVSVTKVALMALTSYNNLRLITV